LDPGENLQSWSSQRWAWQSGEDDRIKKAIPTHVNGLSYQQFAHPINYIIFALTIITLYYSFIA